LEVKRDIDISITKGFAFVVLGEKRPFFKKNVDMARFKELQIFDLSDFNGLSKGKPRRGNAGCSDFGSMEALKAY